jgi:hypothetical protein
MGSLIGAAFCGSFVKNDFSFNAIRVVPSKVLTVCCINTSKVHTLLLHTLPHI